MRCPTCRIDREMILEVRDAMGEFVDSDETEYGYPSDYRELFERLKEHIKDEGWEE